MNIYHHPEPFHLEAGGVLKDFNIAYHTFGSLNADRSNVIWVCHALTANSDVADWWPHTVEAGKFLDPNRFFIVCANVPGSCYGTTGPTSIDPDTGKPYGHTFPDVTVRDIVNAHRLLARHLGIDSIYALIGSSLGGFQALEWAVMEPQRHQRLIVIASGSHCSPWLAAINKAMYMAFEADPSFGTDAPGAGMKAMACARAIGLLSYRSHYAYNLTQADEPSPDGSPQFDRRAHSYQAYQGEKLCRRFDPCSYVAVCRTVDSHDLGRGRGGLQKALASIKARTLVVAISTDILFPPSDHQVMAQAIPGATYTQIDSQFAHDGFLIEHQKLNSLISAFY